MPREVRLFILAGETSGDRIGAALVKGLKQRVDLRVSGVGGEALIGEGLSPIFPMADLSVMGFADVIKRLPKLLWRVEQAVRAVLGQKPDVVVLIDSQVFSAALAKRLRARGFRGPILLYVAPAVWAWKPERAPGLKPLFDEVLAVLPFEPVAMARLGGPPTSYVGHPALDQSAPRVEATASGPLLLLPGSRDGEIARNLPMLREVAARLASHPRVEKLLLPTPGSQHARMAAETAAWPVAVDVVSDEQQKRAAFGSAVAAAAVMGTVTLELAFAGVPMVATYIGDAGQVKRFLKYQVKFAALPNIVLDRPVVPELLLSAPDSARLEAAVRQLLDDPTAGAVQRAAFADLRALMQSGAPEAPRCDPVDRVLDVFDRLSAA